MACAVLLRPNTLLTTRDFFALQIQPTQERDGLRSPAEAHLIGQDRAVNAPFCTLDP